MNRLSYQGLRATLAGARAQLTTRAFFDWNRDWRRAAAIAGCERSGTTWLANIVNYRNDFRLLFEPLRPGMAFTQGINQRTYLRPDDPAPAFRALMERILAGGVRDPHVDHLNLRLLPCRRLAKFVRANLLLKWLVHRFPGVPVLFLTRHPFAVAASRMRKGWNWFPSIKASLFEQPQLRADVLDAHAARFERAASPFVQGVLIWCVEHIVPFRQLAPGDVRLVFYEDLVTAPRASIPPLLAHAGVPLRERVFDVLDVPSPTSSERSARLVDRDALLRDHGVSAAEIDEAMDALRAFGLDRVYGEGPEPLCREPFGLF